MLSFELSVIDIVLTIAVIVLLMLFLGQRRNQSKTRSELPVKSEQKLPEKPKVPVKTGQEKISVEQMPTDFECRHDYGYLKNMPKNTPVPDECFGCPKILRCLFPEGEQNWQVH